MALIRVRCWGCGGSGYISGERKPEHHFDDYCKACSGTGRVEVSEDEAKAMLLQKQIDDAEL